jgi:hypothetical protein
MNYEWVKQQFIEAKVRVGVGKAVLKLLETWETIDGMTPQAQRDALSVFETLALGHSLTPDGKNEMWVDGGPGMFIVGDPIRVAKDAFDGPTGAMHNGRRGVIVAIRSGDIIINSTDGKEPKLDGTHYSPYKLQKRIK